MPFTPVSVPSSSSSESFQPRFDMIYVNSHTHTRIPYTMAKFVVYEKVAEAVYRQFPKKDMSDGMQTVVNLGSGLTAGFAAAIVSQPADTMLSKINKTKGLPGEGTVSRLVKIGKELGLRGSYSGIGARLFMVGTLTAGQFAIYGDLKKVCKAQSSNV